MDPDEERPPDPWFGTLAWGFGCFALVLVAALALSIVIAVIVVVAGLVSSGPM